MPASHTTKWHVDADLVDRLDDALGDPVAALDAGKMLTTMVSTFLSPKTVRSDFATRSRQGAAYVEEAG
jgi:hypothetical protein